ncbi:MAG: uracil-DNA glycosylase [Clostridia bacterium]|nr:uracil-DNA glycosylase [Clostridia bacterium]
MIMTIEELRAQCENCRKCALAETRTKVVIGRGDPHADLMFVGEAPGQTEDETGIPFVGAAGQLFDRYLIAAGIDREEVYVCNILKCRPPHNRDPLPEEQDACIGYLRSQVRIVDPKIIVCLGRISAMRMIDPAFRITRDHGKFYQKGKFLMCAHYHPSALLHDPSKKEEALADMLALAEKYRALRGGE